MYTHIYTYVFIYKKHIFAPFQSLSKLRLIRRISKTIFPVLSTVSEMQYYLMKITIIQDFLLLFVSFATFR